jgi:dienelactone hydrolase
MMRLSFAPLAAALFAVSAPVVAAPTPVLLKAADGVVVHGAYYKARAPKALILLFHQAGSSKDEYATIAPRLVEAGYSAMAIDQRSGGDLFGPNQTAAALGHKADYLEARADLEAAVRWGEAQKLPVILWGSSYSASLVFLAAANHPELKAVLAFSPGEYFDDKNMVKQAAAKVRVPVYVTSASDPEEIAAAKSILAASPATVKVQFVPKAGVHASSTLLPARNPKGAAANWPPVLVFLRRVAG